MTDIEEVINGVDHLHLNNYYEKIKADYPGIDEFFKEFIEHMNTTNSGNRKIKSFIRTLEKKYSIKPRNSTLIYLVKKHYQDDKSLFKNRDSSKVYYKCMLLLRSKQHGLYQVFFKLRL